MLPFPSIHSSLNFREWEGKWAHYNLTGHLPCSLPHEMTRPSDLCPRFKVSLALRWMLDVLLDQIKCSIDFWGLTLILKTSLWGRLCHCGDERRRFWMVKWLAQGLTVREGRRTSGVRSLPGIPLPLWGQRTVLLGNVVHGHPHQGYGPVIKCKCLGTFRSLIPWVWVGPGICTFHKLPEWFSTTKG